MFWSKTLWNYTLVVEMSRDTPFGVNVHAWPL